MNYIVLINAFWALRRSQKISNLQADLYFFLLHESNSRNWQNPYYCSNQMVCASLGISEKSLIAARIALREFGLIEFENGVTKRIPPRYYILDSCNKVSNQGSNRGGIESSNQGSIGGGIDGNILYKQNETKRNKTKQNSSFCDNVIEVKNANSEKTLNEQEIGKTIEYIRFTGQRTLNQEQVKTYWHAFLIHSEGEFYKSRADKIQHFRNWLKKQPHENHKRTTSDTAAPGKEYSSTL